MALRARIAYLRKEHRELLQLADEIESALALGAKAGFPEHRKFISKLRALEHGFQGIEERCNAEKRVVESTYQSHIADKEQLLRGIWRSEARRQRARKRRRSKPMAVKRKVSVTKGHERVSKETSYIPYTMEPHPEL